jgi:hypothetical protein
MLEFIYSSAGSGLSFQANMQIRKTLMSGRGTGAVREEAGIWEIGLLAVTGLVDFLCGLTTKNSGILWLCRVGSCFRLLNTEWMWKEGGVFGTLRCDSFGVKEIVKYSFHLTNFEIVRWVWYSVRRLGASGREPVRYRHVLRVTSPLQPVLLLSAPLISLVHLGTSVPPRPQRVVRIDN